MVLMRCNVLNSTALVWTGFVSLTFRTDLRGFSCVLVFTSHAGRALVYDSAVSNMPLVLLQASVYMMLIKQLPGLHWSSVDSLLKNQN